MLIESTTSPWYLPGADLQTVVPHLRSIRDVTYKRQRVELDDGDFVDVDWSAEGRDRLVIIVHGLEATRGVPICGRPCGLLIEQGGMHWREHASL